MPAQSFIPGEMPAQARRPIALGAAGVYVAACRKQKLTQPADDDPGVRRQYNVELIDRRL